MNFHVDIDGVSEIRHKFLYGFDNICVIFRTDKFDNLNMDSSDYEIVAYAFHDDYFLEDLLFDIRVIMDSNQYQIRKDDIIGAKINGVNVFFRCINRKFYEVKSFTDKEKSDFIAGLHQNMQVFNAIDGHIYYIDELDLKKTKFYAIQGEEYRMDLRDKRNYITMDYYLYKMDKERIIPVNPYHRPFLDIASVLAYFFNCKDFSADSKSNRSFLLTDRRELSFLQECCLVKPCLAV